MIRSIKRAKQRTEADRSHLVNSVSDIIHSVREHGDSALKQYNKRFDLCSRDCLRISDDEIREAYQMISTEEIQNIKEAATNITAFAKAQKNTINSLNGFSPIKGLTLGHRVIPINSCCCYVPGGGYPLYSTALMLGIPAKVAGVGRIAACSPVMSGTDKIHPKTLVAMDIAGVDEIYAVGGAQAIAAFSYGTRQISPVDIIVGPGNSYVTEAKRQCYGKVGIDFLAGPSEVLIIADESADAEILAADLLAQSEHDKEAKGILITTDTALANKVLQSVAYQLNSLPTKEIAEKSWSNFGEILIADSFEEAVDYANNYAPEHLEINVNEARQNEIAERLFNYGSLFIGGNTAEVFGDYASGTNHTLPTLRAARYTGGVWVGTFLKVCTYQSMSEAAMKELSPLVSRLAKGEGLIGHARAAEIRIEKLKK